MFAEDLSTFLSTDEFGVLCTLPGGAVVPVIFDDAYEGALGGAFESSGPTALGKTADLSALQHGNALQINGLSWQVVGVEPDGTGMTRLRLERVTP